MITIVNVIDALVKSMIVDGVFLHPLSHCFNGVGMAQLELSQYKTWGSLMVVKQSLLIVPIV